MHDLTNPAGLDGLQFYFGKDFTDGVMEYQIGRMVHIGARFVDEYQFVAVIVAHEAGSRIDDEAGTADDEHIGMTDVV